jgi:hypothetical protein
LVSAGGVAIIKPSGAGRAGKLKEFSAGVKRDTCEKGSAGAVFAAFICAPAFIAIKRMDPIRKPAFRIA